MHHNLSPYLPIHASTWAFLVIFFIVSYIFAKQKITHMILRLVYLIMLVTGIAMLVILHFPVKFDIKLIVALVMIGMMEMSIVRKRKGNPSFVFFIISIILLLVVIGIGMHWIG